MRADRAGGRSGLRVGMRCDAGTQIGVGHLIRCVALAEELVSRGVDVVFLGDLGGMAWALRQLSSRGLPLLPAPAEPEALLDLVRRRHLRAVVLDGYSLPAHSGAALRAGGLRVLAVVDGSFGLDQEADLYLDQNPGAADRLQTFPRAASPDGGAQALAGLRFALLRDLVRERRPPSAPPPRRQPAVPSVLAVFGGTDPHGAAAQVVPLLLATGRPLTVTVVAGRPETAATLSGLPTAESQRITVSPPLDDLPAAARVADLVVTAAGSSVWELLCLGTPTAVVCVTDNQEVGYRHVIAQRLAAPVGVLGELRALDPGARRAAVRVLDGLLSDPSARAELAARGWAQVDGRGRERVSDALLAGLE